MRFLRLKLPLFVQTRPVAVSPHALPPLEVTTLKHVVIALGEHPVVALPLCPALARDLDEAFVEREVVPDGVLPALAVLTPVVGEPLLDPVVDLTQLQLLGGTVADGH